MIKENIVKKCREKHYKDGAKSSSMCLHILEIPCKIFERHYKRLLLKALIFFP